MKAPEALKRYRLAAGFTQQQIAYVLDVSMRTVVRWESGDSIPRADYTAGLDWLIGLPSKIWLEPHLLDRYRVRHQIILAGDSRRTNESQCVCHNRGDEHGGAF